MGPRPQQRRTTINYNYWAPWIGPGQTQGGHGQQYNGYPPMYPNPQMPMAPPMCPNPWMNSPTHPNPQMWMSSPIHPSPPMWMNSPIHQNSQMWMNPPMYSGSQMWTNPPVYSSLQMWTSPPMDRISEMGMHLPMDMNSSEGQQPAANALLPKHMSTEPCQCSQPEHQKSKEDRSTSTQPSTTKRAAVDTNDPRSRKRVVQDGTGHIKTSFKTYAVEVQRSPIPASELVTSLPRQEPSYPSGDDVRDPDLAVQQLEDGMTVSRNNVGTNDHISDTESDQLSTISDADDVDVKKLLVATRRSKTRITTTKMSKLSHETATYSGMAQPGKAFIGTTNAYEVSSRERESIIRYGSKTVVTAPGTNKPSPMNVRYSNRIKRSEEIEEEQRFVQDSEAEDGD